MSGSSGSSASGSVQTEKDKDSLWYFSSDELANSPSRKHGIDADQELSYRQMTAYLIQEMGQRLQVSQLCINTAIVYMHRFYAFHSFTHFHRNGIAAASLFLAAKVEEQPRKLEHVIKASNKCLNQPNCATTDSYYTEQAQDLVFNENVLLQTLGFDVAIDHPHTHVVKTCQLVKACKDLAQTSYFLASNSLHLTSMCLQYKPTVVACFCIYLACKWSRWEIPQSTEGKHWFYYVDRSVTMELLKQLTDEFIAIYEKSPARLKSKLNSIKALAQGASNRAVKDKKMPQDDWKMADMMKSYHSSINTNDSSTSSYNLTNPNEPMPNITAILPPPQPPMQVRKSDMHSSQHRSHHSSSTHHHNKVNYNSGDVTDHKHMHKQQPYNSNLPNRSRDSTQTHQSMMSSSAVSLQAASTSRSNMPMLNVRSTTSTSLVGQSSAPRPVSQQHSDPNFHKPRADRINQPPQLLHNVPQHATVKMSQKPETNRIPSKDMPVRIPEQVKHSAKLYPPTSMGLTSHFPNNQHPMTTKSENSSDVNRNLMHNQRPYNNSSNNSTSSSSSSSTSSLPNSFTYHQPQVQRPNNSNNNNNNKHDQTKLLSVHMQQHKQLQQNDTSFGNGAHDSQQLPNQQHLNSFTTLSQRGSEAMHSEDQGSAQFTAHNMLQQRPVHTQAKTANQSMFSPDWSDKTQHSLLPNNNNGGQNISNACDPYGLKLPTNVKESPKRNERDLISEALMKKEKNRLSFGTDNTALNMLRSNLLSHQMQHTQLPQSKQILQRKQESNFNEFVGTSIGAVGSIKRPNEGITIKQEDELLRDSKIRKIETDNKSSAELGKLHVINGIETNPDLVRNLLKESLCTTSTFIKTEPIPAPSLRPPAELLEPTPITTIMKDVKEVTAITEQSALSEQLGGKAEKKKKKDKHKHKEKDKSKDKEERKKHKKDKDKHKDRDKELEGSEPVKLKIPKEKLEGVNLSGEPLGGFKIKIPKDRISGDINNTNMGHSNSSLEVGAMPITPGLKIKISKDKIETYSGPTTDMMNAIQTTPSGQIGSSYYQTYSTHNSSSSQSSGSSSGKKKDRDRDRERDRDKEKKRNLHELLKSNGNLNAANAAVGAAAVNLNNPLIKSQNSSKF
ncbi:cyclin-T isoform X2 [Teleopsis dalmanni]|uniref:cyclin-T isoform X2 n=1 Tax=Teleopsis dalmanni TaxID=139649 RepID=UPI0018CD6F57|nr:cyclin-T isoform X2 [Teleopsis dalmanni]